MSRPARYLLTSTTIVALVVIALLVYGIVAGPSPDDATAGATPSPSLRRRRRLPTTAASAGPAGVFSPAEIYRKSAAGVVLVQATVRAARRTRTAASASPSAAGSWSTSRARS